MKKLVLNKETITELDKVSQGNIMGGEAGYTSGCTDGCGSISTQSAATFWNCTQTNCTADCCGTNACDTGFTCTAMAPEPNAPDTK